MIILRRSYILASKKREGWEGPYSIMYQHTFQKKVQTKETGSLRTQTQTPPWKILRYQNIGLRSRYSFLEIVSVSSLAEQSVPVKLPVNDAFLWFWWRGRVFGVLKKRAIVCNCCLQIFEIPLWKWSEKWELIEISVEFILKWKGLSHCHLRLG